MFWSFGQEACGILAPQPRIELASPALESEVLAIGPLWMSQGSVTLYFPSHKMSFGGKNIQSVQLIICRQLAFPDEC